MHLTDNSVVEDSLVLGSIVRSADNSEKPSPEYASIVESPL